MKEEAYTEEANKFYQREMEAVAEIVRYVQMDSDGYLEEQLEGDISESQEEHVAELRSENSALHVEEFRAVEILTAFNGPQAGYCLFFSNMGHGEWKPVKGYYYFMGQLRERVYFWLTVPQLDMVVEVYEVGIVG
jgi:hypothetical protein